MRRGATEPAGNDGRRPSDVIAAYLRGLREVEVRYVRAINESLRAPAGDGSLPEEFLRLDGEVLAAVRRVREDTCTETARARARRPVLTDPPTHDPDRLVVLSIVHARDGSIHVGTAEGAPLTRYRYRFVLVSGSWRIEERTMHLGPGHRAHWSV